MSVDFSCCIAFGWKVSRQERNEMLEKTDWAYEEGFICINSYDEKTDYIFGVQLSGIDCGDCIELNVLNLAQYIPDDFLEERTAALRAMGMGDWFDNNNERKVPRLYLVGMVC